jgi:hypothetical protein
MIIAASVYAAGSDCEPASGRGANFSAAELMQ